LGNDHEEVEVTDSMIRSARPRWPAWVAFFVALVGGAAASLYLRNELQGARAQAAATNVKVLEAQGKLETSQRSQAEAEARLDKLAAEKTDMGVVPAWFDWPLSVSSVHEMPCTPSTAPMANPSASSTGPCSTGSAPVKTRLPIMSGWKRAPSSFVKNATASGRRVATRASFKVATTSSPPITPRLPS